jgi:glycosyltransferase involved in cell wall biosynthesis
VLCVVIGGSPVNRGLDVKYYNQNYRAIVIDETPVYDPSRLWFLGETTQATVAELLGMSDLHIYPSRPYNVSRSLLEAMSAGCVVLAADTEPIREIITTGATGLLLPAADLDSWVHHALAVLDNPVEYRPLGEAAAKLIRNHYSQDTTLPRLAQALTSLVNQRPRLLTTNH